MKISRILACTENEEARRRGNAVKRRHGRRLAVVERDEENERAGELGREAMLIDLI